VSGSQHFFENRVDLATRMHLCCIGGTLLRHGQEMCDGSYDDDDDEWFLHSFVRSCVRVRLVCVIQLCRRVYCTVPVLCCTADDDVFLPSLVRLRSYFVWWCM